MPCCKRLGARLQPHAPPYRPRTSRARASKASPLKGVPRSAGFLGPLHMPQLPTARTPVRHTAHHSPKLRSCHSQVYFMYSTASPLRATRSGCAFGTSHSVCLCSQHQIASPQWVTCSVSVYALGTRPQAHCGQPIADACTRSHDRIVLHCLALVLVPIHLVSPLSLSLLTSEGRGAFNTPVQAGHSHMQSTTV
jgi:hypothetical protein